MYTLYLKFTLFNSIDMSIVYKYCLIINLANIINNDIHLNYNLMSSKNQNLNFLKKSLNLYLRAKTWKMWPSGSESLASS